MVRHGAKGETRRHQEAEGSMSSNALGNGLAALSPVPLTDGLERG